MFKVLLATSLIAFTLSLNTNNYAYRYSNTIELITNQSMRSSLSDFYLPTSQTYLLYYYDSHTLKIVDDNQRNNYEQYVIPSKFIFGKQISLVVSSNQTKIVKSYQYPDKRIENTYFGAQVMNSVHWINSTTAVIAASTTNNQYIGIYQQNSDIIKFLNIDDYTQQFKDIVQLQGDDLLAIFDYRIFIVNINSLNLYLVSSSYSEKYSNSQCFKVYTVMDQPNNKLTQYILFKQNHYLRLFKRQLTYSQGKIINKSRFSFVIQFQDLSFNCAFNFIDQTQMILINQSSTVIFRSLDVQDAFIGRQTSTLYDDSIKVGCASNNLYLRNGILQEMNFQSFDISIKKRNVSILSNQKKAWIAQNLTIVLGANRTLKVQQGNETITTKQNIIDCELIQNILFLVVTDGSYIYLTPYQTNSHKQFASQVITSLSSSITRIKIQPIKISNVPYTLLTYQQNTLKVVNQIWMFNQTSQKLQQIHNDSYASYDKILIPSQTSYYIKQDIGQKKTTLLFYSLNNSNIKGVVYVDHYKWIRVEENILVIYYDDKKLCNIYYFSIDFQTGAVTIENVNSPTAIQLENMPSDISDNRIFLLKDLRTNAKANNYIIFFYYSSQSFYYNTLDPVLKKHRLQKFNFSPSTSFLITPQILGLNIYFSFTNFQFMKVNFFTDIQQQQLYFSCNLKSLFGNCVSLKMNFQNNKDQIISFVCETTKSQIIYFYNYSSFMNCNNPVKIKTLIFKKGVKSYDISPQGDILVINTKNNNEYLDYFKQSNDKILPIISSSILCISNNGYYFLYLNGSYIFIADTLMFKTQSTGLNLGYKPLCTIDNSGVWSVLYQQNQTLFTVLNRFNVYKSVPLKDQLKRVEFIGNYLLIVTDRDMFYFDKVTKGNINYLIKDASTKDLKIDFNQNYIAYSIYQGTNERMRINICQLGGQCYPQLVFDRNHYIFKIQDDGRLLLYDTYYYNSNLQVWSYGLKDCSYGYYISNGQCSQCSDECHTCQAQTGACLDCKTYYGGWVATLVLSCVFFVAFFPLLHFLRKMRKKIEQLEGGDRLMQL